MLAMRIAVCSHEQFRLEQEVSAINSHSLPFGYDRPWETQIMKRLIA